MESYFDEEGHHLIFSKEEISASIAKSENDMYAMLAKASRCIINIQFRDGTVWEETVELNPTT